LGKGRTALKKILIMGLSGSGKTTLASILARRLNAVHFNADAIRAEINKDLGFSIEDRIEQARRMGWLCDQVVKANSPAIADFICPTRETRVAFGPAFTVWVDRIRESKFKDTDRLFVPPDQFDLRVSAEGSPELWAERIVERLRPSFNPKAPTALFVGRYQPFHDGHKALIEEGMRRVGQACIAVRDTHGLGDKDPYRFEQVKERIEAALYAHAGQFVVVQLPNITNIFYGREVGYEIQRLVLPDTIENISATDQRTRIGLG
jgi:adenylylsulfate kinase